MNFKTLDLNLLRVFDEVMAERSLTKAAHHLALTQPAVSNALRRLRETLGDDLMRRSSVKGQGQGLEPTPRALALWPHVREALAQLQASLSPDSFDAATATNTFVLAMSDATAAELLPSLLLITQTEAPSVLLRIVPLTTRDPRRLLEREEFDLAMGYFPAVLADMTAKLQAGGVANFAHQRLYDGEYVCVMRRGHPLAKKALTLNAFCAARHLLVSFSGRPFGFTDEALAALGRKRRIVLSVNQSFTAGRVVAQSDLLTVLPRHFVRVTDTSGELVIKRLPLNVPAIQVDALWHRRTQQNSAHQWLRGAVERSARGVFG
ncbi:MAG: LysR family transcriptional regulator [Cytophagales bacterium]|nr:LysR family transcriptional regulator [Cytophagales bacterium]